MRAELTGLARQIQGTFCVRQNLRVPLAAAAAAATFPVPMPSSIASRPRPSRRAVSSPWILPAASGIHGRGIYARVAIPDRTRVVEYIGERISKTEAKRREEQRVMRQNRGGDGSVYIFELNARHDLDGAKGTNIARLINHSCAPNCRAEIIRGRIWIIAKQDIAAGEELTFDYGYPFGEWALHRCRCGAPRCVGYIVNQSQRWRVRRILRAAGRKKQLVARRAR